MPLDWARAVFSGSHYTACLAISENTKATVNNDFLGHEWAGLPMIFTRDEVISEKHWQIALRLRMYYFISYTSFMPRTHNAAKNNHWLLISPLSLKTVFPELASWRHHIWSVTSRERAVLALWCHIRRLFMHAAQIVTKAIFSRE